MMTDLQQHAIYSKHEHFKHVKLQNKLKVNDLISGFRLGFNTLNTIFFPTQSKRAFHNCNFEVGLAWFYLIVCFLNGAGLVPLLWCSIHTAVPSTGSIKLCSLHKKVMVKCSATHRPSCASYYLALYSHGNKAHKHY